MKNILNISSLSCGAKKTRRQQGLVLEIVLVVIIAMLFATIGLYRSVDASTGVVGNLVFKRDAENRTRVAVHEALTWVENDINYQDFISNGVDDPTNNFSARMLQTDSKGIPVVLVGDTGAFDTVYTKTPTSQMKDDGAGMRVRYVIERMCTRLGEISSEYCSATSEAGKTGGGQPGKSSDGSYRPLLRVSIRVDGPRNTVAYSQAMIDP
jgi:Tfp pilus assembly protein PilX